MKEKIKGHYKRDLIKGTLSFMLKYLAFGMVSAVFVTIGIGLLLFASRHPLPSLIVVCILTWVVYSIYRGAEYADSQQDEDD